MELELNKPVVLELLYDEPATGESKYGEYFLYSVKNANGEYIFFPPEELHEKMKLLHKGDRIELLKTAEQKGSKILTKYELKLIPKNNEKQPDNKTNGKDVTSHKDSYFDVMLQSYEDAMKIQEKLNGMVDVNKIAITLFIARSKVSFNYN